MAAMSVTPLETRIEALLQNADWVRQLALRLVGDRERADDLIQETWLSAVERPPRDLGKPRSWLATVMRRLRNRARRAEVRRTRHESLVPIARHAAPADSVVEQADAHRRVVEAVLALEEPFRST